MRPGESSRNGWDRARNRRRALNAEAVRRAYRRYARGYDLYFGRILEPGRRAAVEWMRTAPGDRVLEVGVGTGLSLPLYPAGARVTGIDLSGEMLAVARLRAARLGRAGIDLEEMDGRYMVFPDASFDKVVAMYVVSVTPDPERLVSEMRRVCRPGGELYVVNHFRSDNPLLGTMERLLAPLSGLLGFRTDLSLEEFLQETDLEVEARRRVNLLGYWTCLRARNGPVRERGRAARHERAKVDVVGT